MNGTTRHLLVGFTAAVLLAPPAAPYAAETEQPIVGAIRWDAWYGENGPVKQTEVSLGPPKYHFRLPWFAREAPMAESSGSTSR